MNYLLKIALLILFFSSFGSATASGPDNFDVCSVASDDVLWIHPTANYKSKKIGKIPYNARCLKNSGCKGGWCKVNYRGVVGWVNGKFLEESNNCPQDSYSSDNLQKQKKLHLRFTNQMLQGEVLQTQMYGSDLSITFLPTQFKSFDGEILFHFSSNDPEQDEVLAYRLIDGKIVYYGNDGSKYRMTLHSTTPTSWIILEEEDIDGDDKQFGFRKAVKYVYKLQRFVNVPSSGVSSNEEYDKQYMQIYGRLDTRMASNTEYLNEVNKFITTAAPYLMDKCKYDLKLHNIRLNKNISTSRETMNQKNNFLKHLGNIENLDGKIIKGYDGDNYKTFNELEKAFKIAGKKSMELQRMNYQEEREREQLVRQMKKLLDRSGTKQQKREISKLELAGQKYDYEYYKNLLDDNNILLMPDRRGTQEKPIFHNMLFILALLIKKQSLKYLNSEKLFQANSIKERIQNIESKSKKLKHQFNQDYLYELRTKPPMYSN